MWPSENLTNFETSLCGAGSGDSWNGKQSRTNMSPHTFEPCVVLRRRHVIPAATIHKCCFVLAVAAICCWHLPVLVHGAAVNHQVKSHNIVGLYAWNNFSENDGPSGGVASDVQDAELASTITVDLQLPLNDLAQMSAESSVVEAAAKANTGCPPTTSSHCLRCNPVGCVKCTAYLVTDTRQCVDQCPSGYIDQWSAHTEFMGRVCTPTNYSGALVAGIAGLLGGFLVCFSLLAVAVMVVRRKRRRKSIKQKLINETTMDRSDFLRQLNSMRPNAEYFLAMLNDTRRQIRKLYLSGEVAAANSYRPIVRDLAKILILLNRPIELIPSAPHDWTRLHAWSEHALERYKPQVGQLIDFFQTPLGEDFDAAAFQQKTNIFRHGPLAGAAQSKAATKATASQKLHMFGSLISLHEFEEPRASDPFGSTFNTLKGGNLITDLNASSLWLEDEFYKLGFRPQDEITTEL